MESMEKQRRRQMQVRRTRLNIEEEHLGRLLWMTALELGAVLGTAMLQAYFVRSLIDNNNIL